MTTEKDTIINMIKYLPDDASAEDITEAIYVRQKIEKGLEDSRNGNTITHDEAKERLEHWL
ncbi:MAG: hypothetical protein JW891_08570 [Candidatus Lokiarchaeota archaeon]|nr:hypothetical protein [Candidatus Lokiarchaeota archaeon]